MNKSDQNKREKRKEKEIGKWKRKLPKKEATK